MPFAKSNSAGYSKSFPLVLLRKMGFIALAWIVVFFISHPFRTDNGGLNALWLFAPLVGAFSGLVAGWYMATDAVEESSLTGITLWAILVVAATLPMWIVDPLLSHLIGWPMNFAGFMVLTSATLLALGAAVWHASSQE